MPSTLTSGCLSSVANAMPPSLSLPPSHHCCPPLFCMPPPTPCLAFTGSQPSHCPLVVTLVAMLTVASQCLGQCPHWTLNLLSTSFTPSSPWPSHHVRVMPCSLPQHALPRHPCLRDSGHGWNTLLSATAPAAPQALPDFSTSANSLCQGLEGL